MAQNSWRHSRRSCKHRRRSNDGSRGCHDVRDWRGFSQLHSKLFDISKPKVSNIVSCQIRINDEGGASRSKQLLQRAHGEQRRSPLMVFWRQYVDVVFPQCLFVVLIQQNLSAIFSKLDSRRCLTIQIFYIRNGRVYKMLFRWWNMQ